MKEVKEKRKDKEEKRKENKSMKLSSIVFLNSNSP